jgi:hypothetical protein
MRQHGRSSSVCPRGWQGLVEVDGAADDVEAEAAGAYFGGLAQSALAVTIRSVDRTAQGLDARSQCHPGIGHVLTQREVTDLLQCEAAQRQDPAVVEPLLDFGSRCFVDATRRSALEDLRRHHIGRHLRAASHAVDAAGMPLGARQRARESGVDVAVVATLGQIAQLDQVSL